MTGQRLDSPLVYVCAHNVYYVKSCLSDAKCFSGSRYSFRMHQMQTTRTPYSISFMATVLLLLLFACHSTVANAAVALEYAADNQRY